MASKARARRDRLVLTAAPTAMRFTGRMAPENGTTGKHNIGSASVLSHVPAHGRREKSEAECPGSRTTRRPTPIDM